MIADSAAGSKTASSERVELVRRLLTTLSNRDVVAATVELSAATTYHVPGHNRLAGTFTGRQAIAAHFSRHFALRPIPKSLAGSTGWWAQISSQRWSRRRFGIELPSSKARSASSSPSGTRMKCSKSRSSSMIKLDLTGSSVRANSRSATDLFLIVCDDFVPQGTINAAWSGWADGDRSPNPERMKPIDPSPSDARLHDADSRASVGFGRSALARYRRTALPDPWESPLSNHLVA